LACVVAVGGSAAADSGDPVAIRHLPGGGFAIESMWNFSIVISVGEHETGLAAGVDVLRKGVPPQAGKARPDRFLVDAGGGSLDRVLDRLPNQAEPRWTAWSDTAEYSGNAIRVRVSPDGDEVTVDVDGIQVTHLLVAGELDYPSRSERVLESDVVLFSTEPSDVAQVDHAGAISGLPEGPATIVLGSRAPRFTGPNTVAIRCGEACDAHVRRMVILSGRPTERDPDLQLLIERKQAACEASQAVFAGLSAGQMNFRPANGTHTPRWNAEHMMGRELLFFSQIYHAVDANVPIMDLNPAQMPPDYQPRHPQWTGAEEARQMERVSAFTRRFAYLLDGLPLDERAADSRWTPRGLLRQMERHYNEHTANVKKKFELDDWPPQ
jgi:hypothetical protein